MDLKKVGKKILIQNMGISEGESVLVVTDTAQLKFGQAVFDGAQDLNCEAMLMVMRPRGKSGEEPPQAVANAMAKADIILAFTLESLTHTRATGNARKGGARVVSCPRINEKIMLGGGMMANYQDIYKEANRLAESLQGTKRAVVRSESGTNLTFDLTGRKWFVEAGICHNRGEIINLPSGEVYIAPRSADGTVVIDTTFKPLGRLKSPIRMEVRGGKVVSFEGDRSDEVEAIIADAGENARNIAELAIGMNRAVTEFIGLTLQDEKVAGSLHVALGDNSTIGGDVEAEIHFDGIIAEGPELTVDGRKVELPSRN